MSFDFANTFAADFGEKLKIDSKIEDETDEIEYKPQFVKKSVTKSVKPLKKSKKSIEFKVSRDNGVDVNFEHSMDAMIVSGVNKGRQVEVRYVLPANYEVEIGVNYDIDSSKRLEKGEIIDHCVVLAEIGVNKYLTHCKKILFLYDRDIKHIKDGVVMIKRGDYKGVMGRIIRYNESKIGALLNFSPIIINRSELFFNDILLKNGRYFQVNRVELGDKGLYRMYGFEFGYQNEKMIPVTSNDIMEMSQGFKIAQKEVRYIEEETTFDFTDEEESGEEESGEEESGEEESGEEESDEQMGETEEGEEMRSAFTDRMRVYEEKSLSKKKAVYYDIVKKILEIKNIGIDDIGNNYDLLDEIENVLEKITNKLKIYNINFDMSTSLIDLRMIIACMVAYRIVVKGMGLGSFKVYISELYEDNFFVGNVMNSVLLNAPDVFNCSNLKKTRVELQKIEMLMICFDKEIQSLLNYQIRFDEIRSIDLSDLGDTGDLIALKRKPNVFSKRKFSTMEDIRKGEIPVGAKKMVWSGKQMLKIKRIKEKLKNKSGIDKYIYENIVNSPLLLKTARDDVVQYLFNKYKEDFMSNYNKCSEEKCQDRVIKQYLREIKTKNEVTTKYLKLLDVVFQIMNDTEIVSTEDHIIKRFKTLGIDNSELINKK